MARFFAESFERRTGAPLQVVSGDPRTAALVATRRAEPPQRLSLCHPEPLALGDGRYIKSKGAIVVWPTTDTSGTPPAAIKERFPDLVPEVPRAFERAVQGRLPLVRIGWGLIRPQADDKRQTTQDKSPRRTRSPA